MHKIIRHLPEVFEEGPLDEISCESFEAYIAKLLKINVNNQKVYSIFRLLEFAHQEKPNPTIRVDYGRNKKDIKKLWLQEYNWKPITIDYDNAQAALLISNLKKYKHSEGEEWLETRNQQGKLISITFPVSPLLEALKNDHLDTN